eukprot:CAMPEP_0174729582 /NCGR_PEP_ID=MMETSP1094-20130205/53961_1 /TAXON_ID=156173 /ORGANISM="Chrysochromulina brevifilum, Strain UTEX LB 985" /LENGTH=274 /DNA_ID=CAMNT_0015931711 /DNA_START=526 /DNA_END=1349 /DNA_ORIENTATION=+
METARHRSGPAMRSHVSQIDQARCRFRLSRSGCKRREGEARAPPKLACRRRPLLGGIEIGSVHRVALQAVCLEARRAAGFGLFDGQPGGLLKDETLHHPVQARLRVRELLGQRTQRRGGGSIDLIRDEALEKFIHTVARAFCVITSVVATAVAAALSATWRSALCVFCLSPTPSAMMKLLWLEALAMEAARTILGRVARRVLFGRTPPPCIPLAMSFCPPFLFLGGVRGRRFFFFRAKQALTVSGLKLSISVSVESVVASSDSTSAVSGCVSLW